MNNSKTKEAHDMHLNIEISRTISLAYSAVCKPLCKDLNLPQTAFDILMFLGNNPKYKTASSIVKVRHIKANLVSVNVERLVQQGYLIRQPIQGDRRKTELICTQKAQPIISRGKQLQHSFFEKMLSNMDDNTKQVFLSALSIIENNLKAILEAEERQ